MFLQKYLNNFYYNQITEIYNKDYLDILDENNFILICNLFKKYNFYFIEDIILKYLEIFELDVDTVEKGINKLKEKLGDNFIYIIGNNLTYLDDLLPEDE